ncbi:Hsp70 family protein [Nocardia africana]|uniref:Hsp70 family protein n=1 Tax=Nocardia africana TaxID=134964 RepID=UPI001428CAE0|nr:Hsp70 family protein [Nocardia africana]MCC3317760.1 Hsp70 family protein [Nocardia africana]
MGDPVDILLPDGSSVAAADLVAETISQVVADFDPDSVVATVPAWWPAHIVEAQRRALDRAGAEAVVLVAEPLAALRRLEASTPFPPDTPVVVYDSGATGTTVSVVGSGPHSGLLGEPVRSTEVSGAEFDLLTMRYVLANALGETDFDPFDPVVERELSILRNRCADAKHRLSTDTATMVPVRLAGIARDVRLVRDDLEDLFRGPLTDSLNLVHEAVRRAGVDIDRVGRILLTGGGASIGLLTELISGEFAIPIAPVADPGSLSARGAALLAADLYTEAQQHAAALAVPDFELDTEPHAVSDDATTTALPAIGDRTVVEPPPSDTAPPAGTSRWRRVAFIAGAAIAVGAVATGTLALGTAGSPSNSSPSPAAATSAAHAAATSAGVAPAGATDPAHPTAGSPVTVANNTGTARAGTTAAENSAGAPAPGTAAPNSADPNSPAPNSPAPASAAAPNAPAQNSPAPNSPAPQAPPQTPVQTPSAPSVPSQPTTPSSPGGGSLGNTLGNTLNDGLDQTGNTLGTVLQAPGKVLPHEGN